MGEHLWQEATGMAGTKRTVTAWLLVVGGLAVTTAYLVSDDTGARLELAPLFFGVAMAVVVVRTYRSRSRRGRKRLLDSGSVLAADRSPCPPGRRP
jgi:hypothetical protein